MADAWWHEEDVVNGRVKIKDENGLEVGEMIAQDAPMAAAAPMLCAGLKRIVSAAGESPIGGETVQITLSRSEIDHFRKLIGEAEVGYPAEGEEPAPTGG